MTKIASLFESYFLQQSSCPVGVGMVGKERDRGRGVSKGSVTSHVLCEENTIFFHLFVSYLDNLGIEKYHLPTQSTINSVHFCLLNSK